MIGRSTSLDGQRGPEIEIRQETAADHDAIERVVAEAFASQAEALLVDRIRQSLEYIADMALVALVGDDVVGHVMISGARLRRADDERAIVMLSPLAVSPAHQRTGVGTALVRAVTTLAERRGEPFVVLEGDPAYYRRFGFEHAEPLGITIPLPDWATSEAGQLLRLSRFDPALRGEVLYPKAFDDLEA